MDNIPETNIERSFRELSENISNLWIAIVDEYCKTFLGKLTIRFLNWAERILSG